MPNRLRKTLYIKDEDFRLSFLHGAYITASNLTSSSLKRICEQRLSPLYLSIHATDERIRRKLLGVPQIRPIAGLLKEWRQSGIRFHTQIVVCPGLNDGPVLERTLRRLAAFRPHLLSIAVVPVGLTRHRQGLFPIRPFTPHFAQQVLSTIERLEKMLTNQEGERFLFAADELYILAGRPLPPFSHYVDFPQIENGVGMMRRFLHESARFPITQSKKRRPRTTVMTGYSAFPFMKQLFSRLAKQSGAPFKVIPVLNRLFGPSVTVTGLLCGMDLLESMQTVAPDTDRFLLPPNCLNMDGLMLDDLTPQALSKRLGKPVIVSANPSEWIA